MTAKEVLWSLIDKNRHISAYIRGLVLDLRTSRKKVSTRWGFSLIGNKEMAEGVFEATETNAIRKLLEDVDILINAGANVGYYCCHALALNKEVVAIEPNPKNLGYLLENIYDNGWSGRAEVLPMALGDGVGVLPMWGEGTGASLIRGWAQNADSLRRLVPVTTLDRICNSRLKGLKALILVDVEGAEMMLLKGATRTLAREPRPIWMIEIASTEHQPSGTYFNPDFIATFKLLEAYGYSIYGVDDLERPVSMKELEEAQASRKKYKNNNFIFK